MASRLNPLEAGLRNVARQLDASGRSWALVGGLAVSARCEPRTTRDVDVAVAVTGDADAEALAHDMTSGGVYTIGAVIEQTKTGRLATVRLHPRMGGVLVDLLFASSGIEAEIASMAERIEILPDLTVPVATLGHLVALKVLARDDRSRPQDLDDLNALIAVAKVADLDQARSALSLIDERGYGRERDLLSALKELAG